MATTKSDCPVTRADFLSKATAVTVTVDGTKYELERREFSTGSFGWYLSGKHAIKVGTASVMCQMGINLTVIGSKDAK